MISRRATLALLTVLGIACSSSDGLVISSGSYRDSDTPEGPGLAEHFAEDFPVGVALGGDQLSVFQDILLRDFNRLTAENAMKPSNLQPVQGQWAWEETDQLMAFAQSNGWKVTGHTLLWHTHQGARWMTDTRDRAFADAALCDHITMTITRLATMYPGVIDNWDVVNEAISDNGGYRTDSPWYQTYGGPEFVLRAFECAAAAVATTGQDIKLYYNDFNVVNDVKRASIVELVQYVQAHGIRIDGVGMQAHWQINYPRRAQIEAAFGDILALGVDVKISELDVSAYDDFSAAGPEAELPSLPAIREQQQADRYVEYFRTFRDYSDYISSVTIWGVTDAVSWLNYAGTVRDRKDYPLLYDGDQQPKDAYFELLRL